MFSRHQVKPQCPPLPFSYYTKTSHAKSVNFDNATQNAPGSFPRNFCSSASIKTHTSLAEDILFEDHLIDLVEFQRKYQTNAEFGLMEDQVAERLRYFGRNVLYHPPNESLFVLYIKELFGGFGSVLWVAALLCFSTWWPFGGSHPDSYNLLICVILLAVIFIQGTFTFVQQVNSNNLLGSFQKMLPKRCKVLREGHWSTVKAEDLVPGDVIQVVGGDRVPADSRVVKANQAKCEKSSLTGESEHIAVSAEAAPATVSMTESCNLILSGSSIIEGEVVAVVYRTGNATIIGNIASLTANTKPETSSLQREINHFISIIGFMAVVMSLTFLGVWAVAIRGPHPDFLDLQHIAVVCIISSVAFIPDGLPIAVTMTLTLVAKSMMKVQVLVKRLSVVETLGSATVIATDKTGTITQNRMSASVAWSCGSATGSSSSVDVDSTYFDFLSMANKKHNIRNARNGTWLHTMCLFAVLANKAKIGRSPTAGANDAPESTQAPADHQEAEIIGNPTEAAILRAALNFYSAKAIETQRSLFRIDDEVSFNSRTKYHLVVLSFDVQAVLAAPSDVISAHSKSFFAEKGDHRLVVVKGAPEVIFKMTSNDEGALRSPTLLPSISEQSTTALDKCHAFAHSRATKGERVIGIAFKFVPRDVDAESCKQIDADFVFFGLISLIDPPRAGVKEAVEHCHKAGIKVFMITGDHPATAVAIAKMSSIVTEAADTNGGGGVKLKDLGQINSELMQFNFSCEEINEFDIERPTEPSFFGRIYLSLFAKTSHCTGFAAAPSSTNTSNMFTEQAGAVVIHGNEINTLGRLQWDYLLAHRQIVFARTTPHHKLAIVEQLQRRGEVVAVTGDGVNDAPALKRADIGIAMGIEGSDVSKEAANMILLDDNFASIVAGIREGRLLFDNLKKVIVYLLSAGSFSEILPVACFVFFGLPLPLSPIQMIAICVGTDMLGAVSLAYESPESNIMDRRPRNARTDRLVNMRILWHAFMQTGLFEFCVALLVYMVTMSSKDIIVYDLLWAYERWTREDEPFAGRKYVARQEALNSAQTGFFIALVVMQLWNLLAVRTRRSSGLFSCGCTPAAHRLAAAKGVCGSGAKTAAVGVRKAAAGRKGARLSLPIIMLLQVALACCVCYVPLFKRLLRIGDAEWYHWAIPVVCGAYMLLWDEWRKFIIRHYPHSIVDRMAW